MKGDVTVRAETKKLCIIVMIVPLVMLISHLAMEGVGAFNWSKAAIVFVATLVLSGIATRIYRRISHLDCHLNDMLRFKGQVLQMSSHDLKSPLASMIMAIDLWDHKAETDEVFRERMALLKRQTRAMRRLVDDILLSETAESGRLILHKEDVKVHALIEDARAILAPLNHEKAFNILVDVPDLTCYCDPQRVSQVLMNLISNATRHTPPGGHIFIHAKRMNGNQICFEIEDSGSGIPRERLKNIFDPFETAAGRASGHGLGLFIVKSIVEAHGGRVWAESVVGKGTTMFFTLKCTEEG